MTYQVIIATAADRQIAAISSWWRANRLAAPDLFDDELHKAIVRLRSFPATGSTHRPAAGVRYLLLPVSRYHVYYRLNEDKGRVDVVRVRSALRGTQPSF